MTVRAMAGACDPKIMCCQAVKEDGPEIEAVAMSYSEHVKANIVRTGDGLRDLFSMCKAGAIENVGVHLAPPVALACVGGGVFTGLGKGAISLPGRLWDTGKRFVSGAADGIGSALADVPFFAMEFAGYGQMAIGAVGLKTPVPPPAETVILSGARFSGNAGGGALSIAVAHQPAVVVATSGAVATIGVGIATSSLMVASGDGGEGGGEPPWLAEARRTVEDCRGRLSSAGDPKFERGAAKTLDDIQRALESGNIPLAKLKIRALMTRADRINASVLAENLEKFARSLDRIDSKEITAVMQTVEFRSSGQKHGTLVGKRGSFRR